MEEKNRGGEVFSFVGLPVQLMRTMPSSRTATSDLVREKLTLLLQPLCGAYVAPSKEYDSRSNEFQ